jgi:hypothetical protein
VFVPVATGVGDCVGQDRLCRIDRAAVAKGAPQVGKKCRMLPIVAFEQAACSLEERHGRARLEAIEGPTTGSREQQASSSRLLFGGGIDPAEFNPVLVRLFQVVADDLVGRADLSVRPSSHE